MAKNILIVVNCYLFCCFSTAPAISFSIKHLDDKKIELTVNNKSPSNKILLVETKTVVASPQQVVLNISHLKTSLPIQSQ